MANPLDQQIKELEKKLRRYCEKDLPKAASSALNKITAKVKTKVVREVAGELKIPVKILKTQVAVGKAKPSGLTAKISSSLRPVAAVRLLTDAQLLAARGRGTNARGVRAGGQQIDGAFINVGRKTGNYHVLVRRGAARYPVRKVSFPVADVMTEKQQATAQQMIEQEYKPLLIKELGFRISKYE